jgi:oligopeptide/dipeptide ABC transporter ATP-binding protein
VADVDLDIATGEAIGVVGESGSGKTMMASALAQLVPYPGRVTWDRLEFGGQELNRLSGRARERFLAAAVAMVFQDPMTSLNPAIRLGRQVGEIGEVHLGMSRRAARQAVEQRLGEVQLPDAHGLVHRYPHELSGGMRQRAVLAMGLMGEPRIIIADEPTTALDVTVQREVLELLRRLNRDSHISVVLISHDISVVASLCHRVLVMYAGRIVEELLVKDLLQRAAHPYTVALLAAIPDMGVVRGEPLSSIPGRPPDLDKLSAGCPFAPRCSRADATCEAELPPLRELRAGQRAACWHPVNVAEVPGTAPLVQA